MDSNQRPTALVTGASYGIGAAIARGLATDGYNIALCDLRTDTLAETALAVERANAVAASFDLDLRDQTSIERVVRQTVERFGAVDLLVNNAGVPSLGKPAIEVARNEWDAVLAVNLTGTFFMSREVGRHMIAAKHGGAVITIASTHGLVGFPGASTYGIAKAGLLQMTRMLSIEWAQHSIRVNAIAPGTTDTPTRAPSLADPKRRAQMLNRIPLHRFGEAEEMAAAVRYLASAAASYITGQTLVLDGGLTAG